MLVQEKNWEAVASFCSSVMWRKEAAERARERGQDGGDDDAATKVMKEFEQACGFPKVIGAIDGTHIKIRAPKEHSDSYINRKGFHSMDVQLVRDSRGLFTHCYAGHVGSVHDARVFWNSSVADFL
jgi:hypothetical protein